jgi:hypothetical protein
LEENGLAHEVVVECERVEALVKDDDLGLHRTNME